MGAAKGGDAQHLELSEHTGSKYVVISKAKRILSSCVLSINTDVSFPPLMTQGLPMYVGNKFSFKNI